MRASLSVLALAIAALLTPAAIAVADDLGSEVDQGQALAQSLQSGQRSCADLSAADFELIGEDAMDRFIGSRAAHEAMNAHMAAMMGGRGERRMHIALGYRYTGCAGAPPSSWLGPMPGMMGGFGRGYPGGAGPGMMYGGRGYGAMMGGYPFAAGGHDDDLGAVGIAAIVLGAAVLGGLVVGLVLTLRVRRSGSAS